MANNPLVPKREKVTFIDLPKSAGILDDYAVRKNIVTREGTITKVPSEANDIVNKLYVDSNFGLLGGENNWAAINTFLDAVLCYGDFIGIGQIYSQLASYDNWMTSGYLNTEDIFDAQAGVFFDGSVGMPTLRISDTSNTYWTKILHDGIGGSTSAIDTNQAKFYVRINGDNILTINDTGVSVSGSFSADDFPGGTYTPTLTNVANLTSSSASPFQYIILGKTVMAFGIVTFDPTTTLTLTRLGISLPVASNFSSPEQCSGTASATSVLDSPAGIIADATNDRAELSYICTDVTSHSMSVMFHYRII